MATCQLMFKLDMPSRHIGRNMVASGPCLPGCGESSNVVASFDLLGLHHQLLFVFHGL